MNDKNTNHLNLYDYFGFPERQQRGEAKKDFDLEKLQLITVKDSNLWFFDIQLEQYNAWSYHINNFSSSLGLHLLLMYYQYKQNPLDFKGMAKYESPETAHKIFFDTFAEDAALYLVSYFDKHLEMFNDLYNLKRQSGKKNNLSRQQIIKEMKKMEMLQDIANAYEKVEISNEFVEIKKIRDNFVHNKSSTYYGMNVRKTKDKEIGTTYTTFNSTGISTEHTYRKICILINEYAQLCEATNQFFKKQIEEAKQQMD
jgi:hypothetical protein